MMVLRALVYYLLLVVIVVPYWVMIMCVAWLPRIPRWRVIAGWPRLAAWLAIYVLGIRYEVRGRENIPTEPVVILSKHSSAWETLAYSGIFPPHVYVMKRELMWLPFLGWGLAMFNPIFIDRADRKNAMRRTVEIGKERFAQGFNIMMFPEGTRIAVGKRGKYKLGGAVIAIQTGARVLPVAHNAGLLWPRNSFLKHPGKVTVVIGEPIDSAGHTPEQLMRKVEDWIEHQVEILVTRSTRMQLELPLAITPAAAPAGTLRYIQLGSEIVGYRFRRARRRSIGIMIDDDGLRVAAPGHTPTAEVEAFIREKAQWVLKKLSEWRNAPKRPVVTWADGATIAFLGAPVTMEFVPGRRDISLENGHLEIGLAPRNEPAALRKRGIAWIKEQALALLGERLALYAARLGVPMPTLALSNARTQWGLCREGGHVRLNWRLIHLPLYLVDYVVAHELAHLREMNHSARFWAVVGGLYPDYRNARSELRRCNHRLPIL